MRKVHCFIESLAGGGAEHQMSILCGLLIDCGYDVTLVTYADVPDHYRVPEKVKRVKLGFRNNPYRTLVHIIWYFLWVKTDCVISFREACNARVLIPLFFRMKLRVIVSERNLTIGVPSIYGKLNYGIFYYRADAIVSNSFSQANFLTGLNKRWCPKVTTVTNYTEVDCFNVSSIPIDCSILHIGVFARYSPQKNPTGLAYALKILKDSEARHFVVHWYGDQGGVENGCNQDYLDLKKLIDTLQIQNIFELNQSVKDVRPIMENMHAVCLPSLYEGFSNSISEGICCGKPVLASNVSDNILMIHDGINGFLFDPNNVNSIADSFRSFFKLTHSEMVMMAKQSRIIAETLFNKEKFVNSYVNLIEQ